MDWSKLNRDQLKDFLQLHQIEITEKLSKQTLELLAQLLFEELSTTPNAQITIPVRDLFISSTLRDNPQKYTRSQIFNLKKSRYGKQREQFASQLYLSPAEPNLVDHIYQILSLADLIIPDPQILQFSFLPFDLLRRIALNIEYDDLANYCVISRELIQLCKEEIFWLDKIAHDFGITLTSNPTIPGKKRYLQIAIQEHYPIENSIYSYRDLLLLIFNAAQIGKATDKLISRINNLFARDRGMNILLISSRMDSFLDIAETIYNKNNISTLTNNWDILEGTLIGAIIVDNQEAIKQLEEKIDRVDFCYVIAGAITNNINLIKSGAINVTGMKYAILFDSKEAVKHMIEIEDFDINQALEIAAEMGTLELFDSLYKQNHEINDEDLLEYAISKGNLLVIQKFVNLGIKPYLDAMVLYIREVPLVLAYLWEFINLSVEDLNSYLGLVASSPHLDLAKILIDRGANNLQDALTIAQEEENEWMAKFLQKNMDVLGNKWETPKIRY